MSTSLAGCNAPPGVTLEPQMAKDKTADTNDPYVYRSKFDTIVVLRPSNKTKHMDKHGFVTDVTTTAIKIPFVHGRFVLDAERAKTIGDGSYTVEEIADMIKNNRGFGRDFILAAGPGAEPTEHTTAFVVESDKIADNRVVPTGQGARGVQPPAKS